MVCLGTTAREVGGEVKGGRVGKPHERGGKLLLTKVNNKENGSWRKLGWIKESQRERALAQKRWAVAMLDSQSGREGWFIRPFACVPSSRPFLIPATIGKKA